jgi:hypothetical protein
VGGLHPSDHRKRLRQAVQRLRPLAEAPSRVKWFAGSSVGQSSVAQFLYVAQRATRSSSAGLCRFVGMVSSTYTRRLSFAGREPHCKPLPKDVNRATHPLEPPCFHPRDPSTLKILADSSPTSHNAAKHAHPCASKKGNPVARRGRIAYRARGENTCSRRQPGYRTAVGHSTSSKESVLHIFREKGWEWGMI